MSLRPIKTLCFCTLLAGAIISYCQANPPTPSASDPPFAPFEKWKSLILGGDSAGLKSLYSSNPVAHVMTASGSVDSDAAVHYWIGLKARDMKTEIVQSLSPQPGSQQLAFQAEIKSGAGESEQTLYITEVQLWQQQGQDWRLAVSKRTDATRLRQPSTANNKIYREKADARAEIKDALAKASQEHKRVLIVFGANWCYDCHVLDLAFERPDVAPLLEENYVLVHVDIGEGDKNQDVMKDYDVPAERGIPAAAVLDSDGKLLFRPKKGEFAKARALAPEDLIKFLQTWKPGPEKS